MRMPIGRTIVVLAGATTLAVGGAAHAASGHHAAASHTVAAEVKSAAMVAEPTLPDTDNIQSGDQTSPDSTANVQSGGRTNSQAGGPDSPAVSGEQTGESGSEQVGNDGPGGHADEPGNPNADHQFQGQE
jgi:hypothetical protein